MVETERWGATFGALCLLFFVFVSFRFVFSRQGRQIKTRGLPTRWDGMGWDSVQVLVEGGVWISVCVCDGMGCTLPRYLTLANWDLSFAFVLGMGFRSDDR